MLSTVLLGVLCITTYVTAHGGVKSLRVDGKMYWANNPGVDERFPVKQISFAQRGRAPFITDQNSPAMACQSDPKPPALVAPVRAGATIEFQWNPWYKSHKGPIVSYMAPYDVPVENIDVNKLEFFKISETGLLKDNLTWAVDEMMANGNKTTAVIPHDIRAGKYVLRHELIALHYATEDSLYLKKADRLLGPQHYIQCFNLEVQGTGSNQPKGVTFPGAYQTFRNEPGLYFDIWRNVAPYPIPGPELYVPKEPRPHLEPLPRSMQSPTGDAEIDKQYEAAIVAASKRADAFTASVNSKALGYGGNPAMDGPPAGSVPVGAVVGGAHWRPTENGLAGVQV